LSGDQQPGGKFVFRFDILQLREKRLHDELRELLHFVMRARISKEEARARGEEAIRRYWVDGAEVVDRAARRQGFEKSPINLFPERLLGENLEKWAKDVDEAPVYFR